MPALSEDAHTPRGRAAVYVAGTAPLMQALGGRDRRRLPDAVDHDAGVRPLHLRSNVGGGHRHRLHGGRLDPRDRSRRGRDGAREIAGMYLANKVQNIDGAADTLLELAEIDPEAIRPVADAMEQGGRLAAKAKVTDDLLDKCKPIAGTPADCIAAIEEYRDAGCTHVMLELWGDDRHEQIRLFGEQVLPHFRS